MRYLSYSRTITLIVSLLILLGVLPAWTQEQGGSDRTGEESMLLLDDGPSREIPEEASPGDEANPTEVPLISTWDFVRMLFILGIVVAAIYLVFFLLKRATRRRIPENEMIRLLGSRVLSGSRSLHLIEVGRSVFLIGETDGGINLLAQIQDQETIDMIRLESTREVKAPGMVFSNLFQSLLAGGKTRRVEVHAAVDYMKQQRERLKKL